jgi:hypothetical protein
LKHNEHGQRTALKRQRSDDFNENRQRCSVRWTGLVIRKDFQNETMLSVQQDSVAVATKLGLFLSDSSEVPPGAC